MDKWNKFIKEHKEETLHHLCSRYSQLRVEDIENIFQDSLMVMHNNILLNKISEPIYPYFLKICNNLSLRTAYKQSTLAEVGINDAEIKVKHAVSQRSIEEILRVCEEQDKAKKESSERKAKLVHAILGEMTEKCKNLLWKHYAEDFSWATIAQMTDMVNADTAKATANRCRKAFKEKFHQLKSRIYG